MRVKNVLFIFKEVFSETQYIRKRSKSEKYPYKHEKAHRNFDDS